MKKMIMVLICSAVIASAQAANEGLHTLMGRARAAVESGDQERMDTQLRAISSYPDHDAPDAMRILLDAGANGAFKKKGMPEGGYGFLEEPTESPLITASICYAARNVQQLREWSQEHDNAIDPNEGRYTWDSDFKKKRDDSLLGKVVTGACALSPMRLTAKVETVRALLQFSDIEIDLPCSTGLTPLHEGVKKTLYELGVGHLQAFEAHLTIVAILCEHKAQVTGAMKEEVQRAAEGKEDLEKCYDRIMEALGQTAVKSACKR